MALERTRFGTMYHIWDSKILSLEVKLQLYDSAVISVLVYGCEAWWLVEAMMRTLNGWNPRCLHLMTGRFYREEAVEPSMALVDLVRSRRLRWLGHVIRAEESYLLKKVVVGYFKEKVEGGYPAGSILMESPHHRTAEELLALAQDREAWKLHVKRLLSK